MKKKLFYSTILGILLTIWTVGTACAGTWQTEGKRWRYCQDDGSYAADIWVVESQKWHYFDDEGYAVTGWIEMDGKHYYFYGDGSMATDVTINGYYLGTDGVEVTGTVIVDTTISESEIVG